LDIVQQSDFLKEIWSTGKKFFGQWFWRTVHRCSNIAITERSPSFLCTEVGWLATLLRQSPVKPIAAAVARKDATSAITAVRHWHKTNHQQSASGSPKQDGLPQ
jgi:hypothetical protein